MRKVFMTAIAVAGGVAIWTSVPATAGSVVDPSTLQPEPPPGAVCRADGPWTICQTTRDASYVNEPFPYLDLPCGTVYETVEDVRQGIRWYLDGRLVKRFVSQNAEGTWSLSATGAGPTVTIELHATWRDEFAVPGDESSASTTFHGSGFSVRASGFGVIAHIAGLDPPDGPHRGALRLVDDPQEAERLCAALTT